MTTRRSQSLAVNARASLSATLNQKEVTEYISGLTTSLSNYQLTRLNTFVKDIKNGLGIDNLSDVFDTMYILSGETKESALKNIVKNQHHCIEHGNGVFTPYRGITGNGIDSYLDMQYNAKTEGVKYTLNDASIGIYTNTIKQEDRADIGIRIGTNRADLTSDLASGAYPAIVINSTTVVAATNDLTSKGLTIGTRSNSGTSGNFIYRDKTNPVNTSGSASTEIPNGNLFILARNTDGAASLFCTKQIAFAFTGRSITTSMRDIIYDAYIKYSNSLPYQYSASSASRSLVDIDTYLAPTNDETIHPSVIDLGSEWNGYRYWMGNTPFPSLLGTPAENENPSIWASNDLSNWVVPSGLTNPITPKPAVGFNADPELYFENGILYCIYIEVGASTKLYAKTSEDGVTWSSAQELIGMTAKGSPILLKNNNEYWLYNSAGVDAARVIKRAKSNNILGPYSDETTLIISGLPATCWYWHQHIIKVNSIYFLVNYSTADTKIYIAFSKDGINFFNYDGTLLLGANASNSWENKGLYRPSLLHISGNDFKMFYGAESFTLGYHTGRVDLTITYK